MFQEGVQETRRGRILALREGGRGKILAFSGRSFSGGSTREFNDFGELRCLYDVRGPGASVGE